MEKGRLSDLQGKGLDDIEINPEDEVSTSDDETGEESIADIHQNIDSQKNTTLHLASNKASSKCSNGKQAGKMRSKWTGEEVKAVERHLFDFITSCRVPGKKDCDSCLKAEPVALKDRDWVAVKYYTHNRIIALKRKINS
ncbi:uncharacterized protein LOC117562561 [Gymnodraco acuticeps]|uniref:Uncharacterized protein LOC117562561 n=1 Tax=Gymnodraco acuticeps TaxID=8218 RepID=A0A6P8X8B7_GYMAC|nr:uncharacterized protein LOC117562561 [Gymnodraco acuticeps]